MFFQVQNFSLSSSIRRIGFLFTIFGILILLVACNPSAQDATQTEPPYFVSLRPDEVWGRRGPSYKQPVLWEYRRRGLPVLVVDETPFWRQVIDPAGEKVWMHKSLLSTRAMVMVVADKPVPIYRTEGQDQIVIAYADPNALLRLGPCLNGRCQVRKENVRGWAEKNVLWGADVSAAVSR